MRFAIVPAALLLASCSLVQRPVQPTPSAPAPAAAVPAPSSSVAAAPTSLPSAPTAATTAPAAAPPATPAAQPLPKGAVVLACTPIEDRQPPAGQVAVAQPFFLLLDANDRPLRFEGGTLPAKIPYQISKMEAANGPPGLRVGAIIHYAAKDAQHEMYTTLAIMKDGTYQVGLVLKTPTQSTNGPVAIGHGTCVGKPA